jgi:hypothetical protein
MNLQSSQWLITFSDLFFILVSFFVLRHELIELPKLSSVYGEISSGSEILSRIHSSFEEYTSNPSEIIQVEIQNDWLSGMNELSLKGELEINTIRKMIHSSQAELSLLVYTFPEDNPESLQKKISVLAKAALSREIELKSISILQANYLKSRSNIAEFRIGFPQSIPE